MGAMGSLATSFVISAETSNQTFPFVRIPKYAAQVAQVLQLTGAVQTYLSPIVKPKQRLAWEAYASSQNDNIWHSINETLDFQKNFDQFDGPMPDEYNWTFIDTIYSDTGEIPYNSTQPVYLPQWESFPIVMKWYAPGNYGKKRN